MLAHLKIENLALIEKAELAFDRGFICFSGETGAGKSVFLGALKLLAGERFDKSMLRQGCESCRVEGLFYFETVNAINALLENYALPPCEDSTLLISRLAGIKGQKIAINGMFTTLNVLKSLGEYWVEFNDPTEPQRLFRSDFQLELLDSFAGLGEALETYTLAFQRWKKAEIALQEIKSASVLTPEGIAYLKNQLGEFEALELTPEGLTLLEHDFDRLKKKEDCLQCLNAIERCFNAEGCGVHGALSQLRNELHKFATKWPMGAVLENRMEGVLVELQDIEDACLQEQLEFEIDAEQSERIQQQMNLLQGLKRRYGSSVEGLVAKRNEILEQLDNAEHNDARLMLLQEASEKYHLECRHLAEKLHLIRANFASDFVEKMMERLKTLGFRRPRFQVEVDKTESLSACGVSRVNFLFASDETLHVGPLAKIASSGELARILLALKTVFVPSKTTPVLIFDEIDANVGGETGAVVGEELRRLAASSQIFCVTHLPQVAAQGTQHFAVKKSMCGENVPTIHFSPLDSNENRLLELARMLGNAQSDSAKKHAQTLLVT